ncbi:methanogenesis marker 8 protein [Methanolapillus ohkumae]|uniref:DUF2099 family protein n=1 Tax=Methanolapillus ohkumae TaxID=3028298 RepID=A0AA96ZVX6_9EURY|nr:hypothetical protein MsAm2_09750 [Methanosarcinaceae archaeon Am2]
MRHIMEMVGKTRVVIEDGAVVEVFNPDIYWCPLFEKARGIQKIDPAEVKKNMEFRIREFGFFTPERKLDGFEDFVGFGASETMMSGLKHGIIDASVSVCDGAGTVVTKNPSLVQGMGARMSGLVYTEPIPEIIQKIKDRDGIIPDEKTAAIDPLLGAKTAADLGFKKIAVTVADAKTAEKIRNFQNERNNEKNNVGNNEKNNIGNNEKNNIGNNEIYFLIIAVHTTGISKEESEELKKYADIVTLCASKHLREIKPLLQVGTAVPLIALTQAGRELLLERAKYVNSTLLVNTMPLPVLPEQKQPKELV